MSNSRDTFAKAYVVMTRKINNNPVNYKPGSGVSFG